MSELTELLSTIGDVKKLAIETAIAITSEKAKVEVTSANAEKARNASFASDQEVLKLQQDSNERVVSLLNLRPEQANNELYKLLSEKANLSREQETLYKEVRGKQSQTFADDPLAWLIARYTVNDTIDEHNTVVDRHNTVSAEINALNTTATAAKAADFAGIAATSAVVKEAQARDLAVKATTAAAAAAKELASFNIDSSFKVLAATGQLAELQQKAYAAYTSEEHLKLSRAAADRAVKEFEQKQDEQKDWQGIADNMSRFYGGQKLSVPFVKRMYSEPGADGVAMRALIKASLTGSPIGSSAGEAIATALHGNIVLANPEQADTFKKLQTTIVQEAVKKSTTPLDAASWKKLGIEGQATVIDNYIRTDIHDKIKKGTFIVTPESIYAAPTYKNMVDRVPDITATVLWDKLKEQPADAKMDYDQIKAIGVGLIKAGAYGPVNAQAIERYADELVRTYNAVNLYVGTQRGLDTVFGVPRLAGTHKVNTGAGIFDRRSSTVDLVKKPEVVRDTLIAVGISTGLFSTTPFVGEWKKGN